MIIESGFDLYELMFGPFQDDDWRVVIVCLDSEMRLRRLKTIATRFAGSLDAHGDEIRAAIDDSTKYFAIGNRVPDTDPHRDMCGEYDMKSAVIGELKKRGVAFLGHQVHDSEYWGSSGPVYHFDSYPGSETMPRNLVIPAPHPFLNCECLVCGPRNAIREEAWRKHSTSAP